MEIAVEKLVCLDSASSQEYLKVLEDIGKEREDLDKRVTEAYKYAPAEQGHITTEYLARDSNKIKVQLGLKPKALHHDATHVEYRV